MSVQCRKMTDRHLLGSIAITRNVDHQMTFSLNENVSENQTLIHFVFPFQNPSAFVDCKGKKKNLLNL